MKNPALYVALLALVVALWRPVDAGPPPPKVLRARCLEIVDAQGKVKIRLRATIDRIYKLPVAELTMHRPNGKVGLSARVSTTNNTVTGKQWDTSAISVNGKGTSASMFAGTGFEPENAYVVLERNQTKRTELNPDGVHVYDKVATKFKAP